MSGADAVLVNLTAGGGRAGARWRQVLQGAEGELLRDAATFVVPAGPAVELRGALVAWWVARLRGGARDLVVAGGDGTAQLGVDTLVEAAHEAGVPLAAIRLGAVGLGSSNDLHKETGRPPTEVPTRLEFGAATPRDLGELVTEAGPRHFVLGVSVGVSAAANAVVNTRGALPWRLRRRSVDLAFVQAGLASILRARPFRARVAVDGQPATERRLANLSVVKSPWLAGGLRFDLDTRPDDGTLGLHLLEWTGARLDLVRALASLYRRGFSRSPGASSRPVRTLTVELETPQPVEVDGETIHARTLALRVLPGALRMCP